MHMHFRVKILWNSDSTGQTN